MFDWSSLVSFNLTFSIDWFSDRINDTSDHSISNRDICLYTGSCYFRSFH